MDCELLLKLSTPSMKSALPLELTLSALREAEICRPKWSDLTCRRVVKSVVAKQTCRNVRL